MKKPEKSDITKAESELTSLLKLYKISLMIETEGLYTDEFLCRIRIDEMDLDEFNNESKSFGREEVDHETIRQLVQDAIQSFTKQIQESCLKTLTKNKNEKS